MCTTDRRHARRQSGVSLLDLILAIVIIGIALAAIASVYITTVQHSADPMVRRQAQLIAEAYLDEILLKKFYDPNTSTVCPAAEGSRSLYDNVCDYNGLSGPAADQFGTPLAAPLSSYNVQVAVTSDNSVTLNGLTNGPAANEIRVMRVDVTVTGPNNTPVSLSAYRTNYNCSTSTDPGCKGP